MLNEKGLNEKEIKFVDLYIQYGDPTGVKAAREVERGRKGMHAKYLTRPHVLDAIKAKGGPEPIVITKSLTTKEHRLVDLYFEHLDLKKVAEVTGILHRDVINEFKKPHIRVEIQKRTDEIRANSIVSAEEVVEELALIAFADIGDFVTFGPDGVAVKNQEEMPTTSVISEVSNSAHGVKFKMHDKMRALENIGKYLGMFRDRIEVTGKDGAPIEMESPLDKMNAKLDQIIKSTNEATKERDKILENKEEEESSE